jgi:hypothetical protein
VPKSESSTVPVRITPIGKESRHPAEIDHTHSSSVRLRLMVKRKGQYLPHEFCLYVDELLYLQLDRTHAFSGSVKGSM